MALNIVPNVGLRGSFEVAGPYDSLMLGQAIYEVIAVETIRSLVLRGEDPYSDHYEPYGVDQERFNMDEASDTLILTMQCAEGDMVHIPSSFIMSLPGMDGVVYELTMLGIALGALPKYLDLESLKGEIAALIQDRAGIDCNIVESSYGPEQLMTNDQHRAMESYRRSSITVRQGTLGRLAETEAALVAVTEKLKICEEFILSLGSEKEVKP